MIMAFSVLTKIFDGFLFNIIKCHPAQILLASTVAVAIALPAASAQAADKAQAQAPFTATQKTAIEKITRDYLIENPDILIEMSKKLRNQEEQKAVQMQERTQKAMRFEAKDLFGDTSDPVAGNPKGSVTLAVFFDYRCPHCKKFSPVMQKLIKKNPNLKVIFKEFPIFGGTSTTAAQAALASAQQGKYVIFHHALMGSTRPLTDDVIFTLAKQSGLNVKRLKKDMNSSLVGKKLQNTYTLAQKLGVMGTPAVFIAPSTIVQSPNKDKAFYLPGAADEMTFNQLIKQAGRNSRS